MSHERQHIDIADYFNERGLFRDLGGHFSRCEKPELTSMNAEAAYPEQVSKGMKALTEAAPSHDLLKLAKAIKGYDTLWEGLKAGFADGIPARIDSEKNDHDLVRLALGLRAYPELETILRDRLADKNHSLDIKTVDCDWGQSCSVISFKRADQGQQLFVAAHGTVSKIDDLRAQDSDLRRLAENIFPQQAPA